MNEARSYDRAQGQLVGAGAAIGMATRNTTVGENIDNRISQLREQIERLEEVKRKLNTGTILDVSLDDLAMAMGRY